MLFLERTHSEAEETFATNPNQIQSVDDGQDRERERDREREAKSQGQVEDDGEVLLAPAACAPAAVVVVVNEEATSRPSSTSGRMYSDDGSKLVSLMVERTVHNSRN